MASLRPLHAQHLNNDRFGIHEEVRFHGKTYIKKKLEYHDPKRFTGVKNPFKRYSQLRAELREKIGILPTLSI